MTILGINAYHGDASAAALRDGMLVAAAEEERFNRVKHSAGFPRQALGYVARVCGASSREPPALAVARDPWARFFHKALHGVRRPASVKGRLGAQLRFRAIGEDAALAIGIQPSELRVIRVEHHAAHLASAFFASPFDEAALYSVDGLGDFASAMWGVGRGNRILPLGSVTFPHSLGIFYTAITQYLGFPRYGDEYKVMGLASYGEPEFLEEFRKIVPAARDGETGFRLDTGYFRHAAEGVAMTWAEGEPAIAPIFSDRLVASLGPARDPAEPITGRHQNLAASMQARLEEVLLDQLRALQRATGSKRLCLAGGVAFNCVANGKILASTGFDELYVPPAPGDAGLAVGAALYTWHQRMGKPRAFVMEHAYWGPEFDGAELERALDPIRAELDRQGASVARVEDEDELCRRAAGAIAAGKIVGWFQGRMEFGPRALGNRSILADPRRAEMRDVLNAKIKRREMFRPFAPSIAEEAAGEFFEQSHPSPFMSMAYRVRPEMRARIAATTHVDGSGRLQTVGRRQNPLYYKLIREFGRLTGVPVLLNTSFNENEPVVCGPKEALDCFLRTKMDALALGRFLLTRSPGEAAADESNSAPARTRER